MKKVFVLCSLILSVVFCQIGLAQTDKGIEIGEVVVTATKTESELEEVSSSVSVITQTEIERKKVDTVAELLRSIPGLDVARSGGPGKNTSVYLRGGNSGHTLVLVDGVQVNSPTLGSFNFADLSVDNIERIEIVRGPQSTLYGSDAIGGVINIITKKGTGKPAVSLLFEGGSYESYRGAASVTAGTEKVDFSLAASYQETDGISAASEEEGNREEDGYKNGTISMRVGAEVFPEARMDVSLRYMDSETDLDALGMDDPNYVQESETIIFGSRFSHYVTQWWEHILKLHFTENELEYTDPDTPWNNFQIDTAIREAEWQHNLYLFDEADILTLGAEYEKQQGENEGVFDDSIINRAAYIQNQVALLDESLFLTVGARVDDHSIFGSEDTYRLGLAYLLKASNTRFKANWGTGFKSPTLNDLFYQDPWGSRGNPELEPEESKGFDVGIEQRLWEDRIFLGATYFYNSVDNLIEWVEYLPWMWEPQNVAEARSEGWEIEAAINPIDEVELSANYTFTDSEDKQTGNELPRRPEHKFNLTLNYQPWNVLNINLDLNYVGRRWDDAANTERSDSYTKLDLAAYYNITDHAQLFGRVENLLDEEYEEVLTYGAPGISAYGGVKLTF
jgi:vitamin B12 transporter